MLRKAGLMVFFCLISIDFVFSAGISERGNGNIVTIDRPVPSSFEKIVSGINGVVNVYQSNNVKVSITIDSNLEECIETEIKNGVLEIKPKSNSREGLRTTVCTIDVYTPNINRLAIEGSGELLIKDKIITESLRLDISGSGGIRGKIECTDLTANISGSGEMAITGKSKKAELDISGSGSFECEGLEIEDAVIKISGSGDARINVTNNLDGKVSGSGNVMYKGNPRITFSGDGSGKLKALN